MTGKSVVKHFSDTGTFLGILDLAVFLPDRDPRRRFGELGDVLPSAIDQLLDADLNLEIGNRYLSMLLSDRYFDKSLILALAAYNGGPGNVRRWRRELKGVTDPLLFIESLPAPETRDYVQKVMSNLWIYRDRLKQEPISQRILAAESWPRYHAQDKVRASVASSVK